MCNSINPDVVLSSPYLSPDLAKGTGVCPEHETPPRTQHPLLVPGHHWEKTHCAPFWLGKDEKGDAHEGKAGTLKSTLWSNFLQIDI